MYFLEAPPNLLCRAADERDPPRAFYDAQFIAWLRNCRFNDGLSHGFNASPVLALKQEVGEEGGTGPGLQEGNKLQPLSRSLHEVLPNGSGGFWFRGGSAALSLVREALCWLWAGHGATAEAGRHIQQVVRGDSSLESHLQRALHGELCPESQAQRAASVKPKEPSLERS